MSPERSDDARLQHIVEAIAAVNRHPVTDRAAFDADELLRYFVLKHIEIVGEAVFKLSDAVKAEHPEVPWHRIATTRHKIVHDYWAVDWDIVWRILTDFLGPLQVQIEAVILGRNHRPD